MSTLPPPKTKPFPKDSLEAKVYKVVNDLSQYLPVVNDRNRLGFNLYKFVTGEGDDPHILVQSAKLKIVGISPEELANKLSDKIKSLK